MLDGGPRCDRLVRDEILGWEEEVVREFVE